MTKKEKLATEYITLRKEFDGPEFNENMPDNQVWYLVREFKIYQLESRIEAVKNLIKEKEHHLKLEAYYATPEGKAYKESLEGQINECNNKRREIRDSFEKWIIDSINTMIPGNWTARLYLGTYMSGNVEIGLVNRDPERTLPMEFGHSFNVYYDDHYLTNGDVRFSLNYGTLGSFDLFNDETRPVYLNGLAKFSNNKEFLNELLNKFEENCKKAKELNETFNELEAKLNNPFS